MKRLSEKGFEIDESLLLDTLGEIRNDGMSDFEALTQAIQIAKRLQYEGENSVYL